MYRGTKYNVFDEWLTVPQACRKHGVTKAMVYNRIKEKGLSVEEAVADAIERQEAYRYTYRGQRMTLSECCAAAGGLVERKYAQSRLEKGWSIERAVETPVVKRSGGKAAQKAEETTELQEQPAEEPETGKRWKNCAAYEPAKVAAAACEWMMGNGAARTFGLRCINPGRTYAFAGEIMEYRVDVEGEWADITAFYKFDGIESDFRRTVRVQDGRVVKSFTYADGRMVEAR